MLGADKDVAESFHFVKKMRTDSFVLFVKKELTSSFVT
jgi:hypothetical protein